MSEISLKSLLSLLFWVMILVLPQLSRADELIYGPEWTFTNSDRLHDRDGFHGQKLIIRIHEKYQSLCATGICRIENLSDEAMKIIFTDGFTLDVNLDPGMIEVQATPLSLKKWKQRRFFIQKYVFELMAECNLAPHEIEGAGHLNIGLNYFKNKSLLFRNFLVDYFNHPGMGTVMNALLANQSDAAFLADVKAEILQQQIRDGFAELQGLDQKSEPPSLLDYLRAFRFLVRTKFIALGLRGNFYGFFDDERRDPQLTDESRMELRALRPQKDMISFLNVIEIYEARFKYLEQKFKKPIALKPIKPVTDGWEAIGEFADYLEESSLDWKDYQHLMLEPWRDLNVESFVRGRSSPQIACWSLF